jgi:lipopolysaccharide transport system permease protein
MSRPGAADAAVTHIRRRSGGRVLPVGELWRYRDLLWLLAMRDVRVRYKQTVLGVLWAVIQPVVTMVVLHVFFGRLMGVAERVGESAYPVFLFAGLVPWTLFASAVAGTSASLVNEAALLRKVYFPRLVTPVAALGAPLVDYAIACGVLLVMAAGFGVGATWRVVLLPALVLSTVAAVLGVGVTLAGLTVSYRDFRHVVPFLVQTWFFLTPVIYPVSIVPERWRWVVSLNPMAGTIEAFRAAVLGTAIDYGAWGVSAGVSVAMLGVGLWWFARVERRFADVV